MQKIVIVDGDLATIETIKTLLNGEDYKISGVGKDGFAALELCKIEKPDILIINSTLPVLSGITAGRKVIAENNVKGVIFLCDDDSEITKENLEKIRSRKTIGWLSKPIQKEALHATLYLGSEQTSVIEQLEKEVYKANKKLVERKVIEKAKGFLMEEQQLSEPEAYRFIQKLSMQKRTSMVEIADIILLGV
ncbi:ANTAR domain-containing response regulator [Alkalibacterium sp. m-11]|jgi:response regulator NasT